MATSDINQVQINQVRQILMNELGLTREFVRDMATELVKQTVNQHVEKMIADGHIKKIVRAEIDRIARTSGWDTQAVRTLISNAAGEHIRQVMFQALNEKQA